MQTLFSDLKNLVLDTVFPISCIACGKPEEVFCVACVNKLKRPENQLCLICRKPSLRGITHAKCQTPFGANGILSAFDYKDEGLAKAIVYGKYKFIPGIYNILGKALAGWLEKESLNDYFENFLLVPIPLSSQRKRWRGFNQSELLAKALEENLGLKTADVLVRTKNTKTQKDLKRTERIQNLDNAFSMKIKYKPWYEKFVIFPNHEEQIPSIKGQNLLLIDDVVTSGSTLKECAKVLKRNGAGMVWCLTVAKD